MNLLVSMRYLVALDEHRHFARAAQACFITQPALSNALRALEAEFGAAIVKRGRSFVGFTPEGERLLESARRMLRDEQLLRQDLSSSEAHPVGRLSLGVVPSAEPVAARFAAQLQARHPGIQPVVRSLSSQEIETGLEDLTLDLGLGFIERVQSKPGVLRTLAQFTEQYFLVRQCTQGSGARLRYGEALSWQQAAELPLALLTPEMHNRRIVEDAFAQAGLRVRPVLETNSLLTLALGALSGPLCAVMPGALLDMVQAYGELQAQPLVEPEVRTPVGFMVHDRERPSRALQAALALAEDPAWLAQAGGPGGGA